MSLTMYKRKFVKLTILILLVIISNILVIKYCNFDDRSITLSYKVISDKQDIYQVFYGRDTSWKQEQSEKLVYKDVQKEEKFTFTIPKESTYLRFELGTQPSNIKISDIKLSYLGSSLNLDLNQLLDKNNEYQIKVIEGENNLLNIEAIGNEPYMTYKLDSNVIIDLMQNGNILNKGLKVAICIMIDILLVILLKKSKSVFSLAQELNNNRVLIWNLSKNDFKTKYAGSYLGITWAFIQPIITILVYWFVFGFGLRANSPIKDVPFIVWFVAGIVPWFFFQEALLNATNCMSEYNYLVKKVLFKISILPIVKIISAFLVHLVFIGFLLFVSTIYGFYPSKTTIQLIYYSFCTFAITLAISYATSSIVVFFKDLREIINIFLQVGMWMTPIMWSYTIIPKQLQWVVKLSPLNYIVEGYRDTIINHTWFYERYFQTVYFWIITLGLFALGAIIFKKLKPHFADVL